MNQVSLTTFVDFVCKSGTPKLTVVKNWKHKPEYSPMFDFYKRFREAVVAMHEDGAPPSTLKSLLHNLKDLKKLANYPEAIEGYRKWHGRREMKWYSPPNGLWAFRGVKVSVNPELGLRIDGTPYLIKLYLKHEALTRNRIDLITHLMQTQCKAQAPRRCVMGVLDVRRAKFHPAPPPNPLLTVQLEAEAACWRHMYGSV